MLVSDLILDRARSVPDRTALIKDELAMTYAELGSSIQAVGRALDVIGVEKGSRVAVWLNKRVENVLACFGSSLAGAVFVPINPSLKARQVARILRDSGATALVTSKIRAATLAEELPTCPDLIHLIAVDGMPDAASMPPGIQTTSWSEFLAATGGDWAAHRGIDADLAAILYTSGTTRHTEPQASGKGVMLTHRNLVAGALSVAEYLENDPDDVLLAALPLSFDAGFSQLTTAFSVGAAVVLIDYLLPGDLIKAISKHRVTGLAGVPTLWNQLARLDWPEGSETTIRYVTNTGDALPAATLAVLRKRLPLARIYLMYGLTEAFRSTYLPPEDIESRPGSIGKAIPNAEVLVVRPDGSLCNPGEPGELVHRGALVALGYWNDPEQTKTRFRPAPNQPAEAPLPEIAVWSGDTVVADRDGYLYFVGRRDDMIKTSGYRVSPVEIEEVAYSTDLVKECAAIGIPDPVLGQAISLLIRPTTPDVDVEAAVLEACRKELPAYMVPSAIHVRKSLPHTPNGKVDRRKLASELAPTATIANVE